MAIDINAIRGRLNKLQNTQKKSDALWKPEFGKQTVRIVPYKFNPENPFIELYFHYGINNKTYVSPISFDRPDPIYDFAEKLKSLGSKEEWKAGKALEPKLRTFVPVLVRGKENEGVKFWGFGKTVYQEILGYIADEDYGDITDPRSGRDITIEYTSAEDSGTSFPVTTIRVKPNATPIMEDVAKVKELMQNQTNITDLYPELSYEELQDVLKKYLSGDDEDEAPAQPAVSSTLSEVSKPSAKAEVPVKKTPPTAKTASDMDDVSAGFDDLFGDS